MTTHAHEPAGSPDPSGPGGLVRLRLDVAYDGTGFHGWARQPGLRSVQAELEHALALVLHVHGTPVRVAVAGRTDSGVHATGQVCHADVPAVAWGAAAVDRPGRSGASGAGPAVLRRLNGLLDADLRVRSVGVAPAGFDARWSATWRRYSYLVADDPAGQDPRARGPGQWHSRALDVAAMAAAAQPFLGEHDFAAFCRAREGSSTVRTVLEIGWSRRGLGSRSGVGPRAGTSPGVASESQGIAEFSIRADAFCHSMVRSLVGAFLAVGEGRWPVTRPAELLAAGHRDPSIATAPAHGLTLLEVGYPPDADLADQAQRARRWRGR